MSKKKNFSLISLGCFRNSYDSEIIAHRLSAAGYRLIANGSPASSRNQKNQHGDLLVINTCGFIKRAKEESLEAITEAVDLKKKGRLEQIMVLGCLVTRYRRELAAAFPEVDRWEDIVRFRDFSPPRKKITPAYLDFLKICEGCSNRCSFCAIPLIKGDLHSRSSKEVLKEAACFNRRGVKELNIIGQDITAWGRDLEGKKDLVSLLRQILEKTPAIGWLRLIYTHPAHISDSLLELVAGEKRICKYIDLPIQHISDRILKAMGRRVGKKNIVKLIAKIRKKIPGCAIRTAVIAGFPGETEKDFKELLAFLRDVRFERLGVFAYSREEGTPAYNFPGQVHPGTKQHRLKVIMQQQRIISRELNKRLIGQETEVLVEEKEKGWFRGRTQYDAPEVDAAVWIKRKGLKPGNFYKLKITDALDYDLIAG